jgi:hypothetical protein
VGICVGGSKAAGGAFRGAFAIEAVRETPSFVLHPGMADVARHEMADRHDLVSCGTHGPRPAAFVCRHVLESLRTRSRVGFHTPDDADDDNQGWCNACERVRAREGEWNDRSEAYADIRLICIDCFQQARELNRPL